MYSHARLAGEGAQSDCIDVAAEEALLRLLLTREVQTLPTTASKGLAVEILGLVDTRFMENSEKSPRSSGSGPQRCSWPKPKIARKMGSQRAKPLLAAWGSRARRCCFVHEEFKFNRVAGRATTRVLQARSADGGGKLSSDVENGKWIVVIPAKIN